MMWTKRVAPEGSKVRFPVAYGAEVAVKVGGPVRKRHYRITEEENGGYRIDYLDVAFWCALSDHTFTTLKAAKAAIAAAHEAWLDKYCDNYDLKRSA